MDHQTRVLILGGAGMLGHKLWLTCKDRFDTSITLRQSFEQVSALGFFERAKTFDGIDLTKLQTLIPVLEKLKPDVVVNCVGVVKQITKEHDPVTSLQINALLPQALAKMAGQFHFKLIHISTDCVFDGTKGNYSEEDPPSAEDLYGLTKLLGEISEPPALTLRTSMIGRELSRHLSLLEWVLCRQPKEKVKGYTHAIFSGFTTPALAEAIAQIIQKQLHLTGIYHLSSHPITKYDLLKKLQKGFGLDIDVTPFDDFCCDRSLNGSRFNKATGFVPPSWDEMIEGLVKENTFYQELKNELRR